MTKKYDVTAIGNALVDYEYRVSEIFFNEHNIEKGVMTLVEEARQKELFSALGNGTFKRQCGGSAANSVIAVSQFGGKSYYCCKVAGDELGEFFKSDLASNGVNSVLENQELPSGTTGACLVMVTDDADRTMNTHLGITQTFSIDELNESAIADSEYVYLEGYLVTSPNGFEAMKKTVELAKKHGVKLALTFSDPNMVKFFKAQFQELLKTKFDLIFCNESEAMEYTGCSTEREAIDELSKLSSSVIVTQGPSGALVKASSGELIDVQGEKVEAIDTNGAGDMFAGAYMYGLTNGMNEKQSCELAVKASARLVQSFGPRLDKEITKSLLG